MVRTRRGTETSTEDLEGSLPVLRPERGRIFGQARPAPIPTPAQWQPSLKILKKLGKGRLRAYEREREHREQEFEQLLQRIEGYRTEMLQLIRSDLREVRDEMLGQMVRMQDAWFQEPHRHPIPTPRTSVNQQQQVPKVVPRSVSFTGGNHIPSPSLLSRSESSGVVSMESPTFAVMSDVTLTSQQSFTSNHNQSRNIDSLTSLHDVCVSVDRGSLKPLVVETHRESSDNSSFINQDTRIGKSDRPVVPTTACSTSSHIVERVEPRARNSQTTIKSSIYNGSTPWDIFERQFRLIARINDWDSLEKAAMLTASLRGPALVVLGSLSDSDAENYERICAALRLRFGEEHLSKLYFSRFEERCQGRNEHLAALGQDLERLIRLAFPECDAKSLDQLACSRFMNAISDPTLRYSLKMASPSSLREAISKGLEMEALFREDSDSIELSQNKKEHSSIQLRGNTPSKQPHPRIFASFDSYRRNRFSKICSFCENKGHETKHCFTLKKNIEALKIVQKGDESSWRLRPKPSGHRSPSFTAVNHSQY